MADKTIGELPGVTSLDSDSLFVAQQQGAASKVTGAQLIQFANVETAAQVSAAQAAAQEAAASETAAETAKNGAETAQTAIENMTVEAETLAAGAQATVQKIVTSGQPIKLLFGLPTGPTGPAGGVDSFNGRTGAVTPRTGDYTAEMVGAAPAIEDTNNPGCFYRMIDGVQEWINPPMVLGVEYRTTERYNGKPVYARLVNVGPFSSPGTNKEVSIETGHSSVELVSCSFRVGQWEVPTTIFGGNRNDSGIVEAYGRASISRLVTYLYTKQRDLSSLNATAYFKYTVEDS